jgi:calcineurin-like phosphoesterase family protein
MNIWLISDTHFGHEKTCTSFKRDDGTPLRPFKSAAEMDEYMVHRWNEVVKPKDKIYHLGDVAIARKSIDILSILNGDKILIRGNHDIFKLEDYTKHFRDIRSYHIQGNLTFSHVPIHPLSLRKDTFNVHGHLHANKVQCESGDDMRYVNVSVEHTNYAPIALEDVQAICKERVESKGSKMTTLKQAAQKAGINFPESYIIKMDDAEKQL